MLWNDAAQSIHHSVKTITNNRLVSCWYLRLNNDRSRCCLFNRNDPVDNRQEKNATCTNFFRLRTRSPQDQITQATVSIDCLNCRQYQVSRTGPDHAIGCFNRLFELPASPSEPDHGKRAFQAIVCFMRCDTRRQLDQMRRDSWTG